MMPKGCQRRLIMMPTKNSPLFETAYFILRRETETKTPRPNEMLYEATRILEENTPGKPRKQLGLCHLALAFFIGFFAGALLLGGIWLGVS